MYDWPSLRKASDHFYREWRDAMRARGLRAPEELSWEPKLSELWADPNLLVAQACGYPLMTGRCGDAQIIATPCYDLDGCDGASYRSILVAHRDRAGASLASFQGSRAAINGWHSHSGFNAFRARVSPLVLEADLESRFFREAVLSHSHLSSMRMVAAGEADIAAIDCVLWGLAAASYPELRAQLTEIDRSAPAPGLPFITAGCRSPDELSAMRAALQETLQRGEIREALACLGICGAEELSRSDYQQILDQEAIGTRAVFGR